MACVLGDVDLVRALALGGIRSVVAAEPGNPARYSRATAGVLEWANPSTSAEVLVERLLEFARRRGTPTALFYDGDWDLLVVSRHRDALAAGFRFVVADRDLVEDLVDKARFQALAERLGLPVPRGRRLAGGQDAVEDLRFPLLVKPLIRLHDTWKPLAAAKAIRVSDAQELRALRSETSRRGIDALVQEEIPGPERRIESYHVYVDADGEIAGEFTGRKLRTHPPGYGYSTALEITRVEDVARAGRGVVRRLGLTGVAKLDFKRDPSGVLHLLEVNPRFNLWHHPAALAGVNLPALVYADVLGVPGMRRPTAWRPGVRWCSLAHDLRAARLDGVATARWLAGVARSEAKSGFAWDDPLPLARAALWRLGRGMRRRRDARAG